MEDYKLKTWVELRKWDVLEITDEDYDTISETDVFYDDDDSCSDPPIQPNRSIK